MKLKIKNEECRMKDGMVNDQVFRLWGLGSGEVVKSSERPNPRQADSLGCLDAWVAGDTLRLVSDTAAVHLRPSYAPGHSVNFGNLRRTSAIFV
jgi:hypothetical protein